jgi:hypothetical protein
MAFRIIICICYLALFKVEAQQPYSVSKISSPLSIDGKLNETAWQNAPVISGFNMWLPVDKGKAKYDSEIKLLYDDKNIYVSGYLHSPGNKFVIPSYKRDFRAGGNDNFSIILDTFSDKTNGFLFGINPYGVQREGLISGGGVENGNLNVYWDNKWKVETQVLDKAWVFEMAIPLSSLRFKDGIKTWNLKMYRFETQGNETTTNIPMPQTQIVMSLGYSQVIEFQESPKKPGANISLIPYALVGSSREFEGALAGTKNKTGIGLDAKVGVSSGLNLDLTVNPDFSNVEADRQIVNLTRFDINLPEQRQFFLENSDLFTGFGTLIANPFLPPSGSGYRSAGNQLYSPFFSRNIGIGYDSTTKLNVQTRINYGARLSGKINNDWRIGLLNTQTAQDLPKGIDAANFSVLALQRAVFGSSNISGIFVNKFNSKANEQGSRDANSIAGLEYNLISKNNKWNGKTYYHHSFGDRSGNQSFAHGFNLNYNTRKLIVRWAHDWIGEGFAAPAGFLQRNNFSHINPTLGINRFPVGKRITRWSYGAAWDEFFSPKVGTMDRKAGPFLLLSYKNTQRLLLSVNHNFTRLLTDFDVLRANGKFPKYAANTSYAYTNAELIYTSDQRKKFNYTLTPTAGQYYDGWINTLSGSAAYRFQPYGFIQMNVSYNDIRVEKGSNKVIVAGPTLDLTLSKKLFITNVVQYNSQIKNLNINSRLQYRFAPVSDIFLVYTDNYNSTVWEPKSRAIFAKISYWLSL